MNKIVIVIPYINLSQQEVDKIKAIYEKRAGVECTCHMIHDAERRGWVALHNEMAKTLDYDWYVYSAQDYFPGRNYLKRALAKAEQFKAKLVGFNDGKWDGVNATAGLVHKSLIEANGWLFYPKYYMHGADPDLTNSTLNKGEYVYCPEAILIEVDYDKDLGTKRSYPQDQVTYKERLARGFNG